MSPRFSPLSFGTASNVRSPSTSHHGAPDPIRERRAATGGPSMPSAALRCARARCPDGDRRMAGRPVEPAGRSEGFRQTDTGPAKCGGRQPGGRGGLCRLPRPARPRISTPPWGATRSDGHRPAEIAEGWNGRYPGAGASRRRPDRDRPSTSAGIGPRCRAAAPAPSRRRIQLHARLDPRRRR
jgi:hypothetical protein